MMRMPVATAMLSATLGLAAASAAFAQSAERRVDNDRNSTKTAEVPRCARIRYQGLDERGQVIDRTVEGFHARVVQHECDHLWGTLFPMRVRDFRQFGFTDVLFPELASR